MKIEDVLDLPEDVIKKKLELAISKDQFNETLVDAVIRGMVLPNEIIKASKDFLEDFEKIENETIVD